MIKKKILTILCTGIMLFTFSCVANAEYHPKTCQTNTPSYFTTNFDTEFELKDAATTLLQLKADNLFYSLCLDADIVKENNGYEIAIAYVDNNEAEYVYRVTGDYDAQTDNSASTVTVQVNVKDSLEYVGLAEKDISKVFITEKSNEILSATFDNRTIGKVNPPTGIKGITPLIGVTIISIGAFIISKKKDK